MEEPTPSVTNPRCVINTTLSPDAYTILRKYCPVGTKRVGVFIDRMIYEFEARAATQADARAAERARLRQVLASVLDEG